MKTLKEIKKGISDEILVYEIQPQGLVNDEKITFYPDKSQCGNIIDGVGLEIGNEGTFVISYEDLIAMADLAKECRDKKDE